MNTQLFSTEKVAQLLSISPRTLERWRVEGGGPIFIKIGRRVAYSKDDVEKWVDSRRKTSTSQADFAG